MRKEVGLPTILVNNAGTVHKEEFSTVATEAWEPMIDLNIKAGLYVISEFLAEMKAAGKGHIVNITSTFEREWMSGMAVYCGSKHFWTGASECLRLELKGSGLKVTNVMPGATNTDMFSGAAAALGLGPEQAVEMGKTVLQAEDIALLVWETVCKPERCYVKDVFMQATHMTV